MASDEPLLYPSPAQKGDPRFSPISESSGANTPHSHSHNSNDTNDGDIAVEGNLSPATVAHEQGQTLGGKDIGFGLSIIFLINQIYGPGLLSIPVVFQQSGVLPTSAMLTLFMFVSCFSATLLCEAIRMIPGNHNFNLRIEFASAVRHYYGERAHTLFQLFLNITLQSYNIASIVICANSLDEAFVTMFGKTYALEFHPSLGFHAFTDCDVLYSSSVITLSLGYIAIMAFCVPMSMLNLDDNVRGVQVASFVALVVLLGEFIVYFLWRGITGNSGGSDDSGDGDDARFHSVPIIGNTYTQLVSVFIFSWAYPIFVPSWLNEKQPNVSVNKTVWYSGIASWIGYMAVGLLCASVNSGETLDNMLDRLSKSPTPWVTRITAYLFSLGVIAPGIPVCSITTRYNLYVGKLAGVKASYFWGVWAPWLFGFIFCQGQIFANLIAWSSLIFNGIANFLVPLHLYYTAASRWKPRHQHRYATIDKDHFAGLPAMLSPIVDEPPQQSHHDDDDNDHDNDDNHGASDSDHPHVVISTGEYSPQQPRSPAPTPAILSTQSSLGSNGSNSSGTGVGGGVGGKNSPRGMTSMVADLPSFGMERSASSVSSLLSVPVENKRTASGGNGNGNNSDDEVPKPSHPLRLDTGASPNLSPRPRLVVGTSTSGGTVNALTPIAADNDHGASSSNASKPIMATLVEWPFPRILRTRTRARVCVISMYISTAIVILAQIAISIYYLVWLDKSLV